MSKWKRFCLYGFSGSLLVSFLIVYVQINNKLKILEKEYSLDSSKAFIKEAHHAPKRFYEIYERMHPNVFNYNFIGAVLFRKSSCPCSYLRYRFVFKPENIWNKVLTNIAVISYLENEFTQKQCFDYILFGADFLYQTKGIEEASCYYFNKDLPELKDRDIITLIYMLDNPAYNNPKRFPNRVNLKVDNMLMQITHI